jgi:O-glycosyl hydrolase
LDGSVERRGRFYAIKHFSNFIGAGWHRVDASTTDADVRVSAYKKDDNSEAALVLVNPGTKPLTFKLPPAAIGFKNPKLYRSTETEAGEKFRELGEVKDGVVTLLGRGVATLHWEK